MIGIRGQLTQVHNPDCTACPLHKSSIHVCVMGRGDVHARVMLVGEAPGEAEGRTGKPFMGAAGQLLNGLLRDVGLEDKVYITNICKCRPPKNRKPEPSEQRQCIKLYLNSEIDIIKPDVIVLLGKVATGALVKFSNWKRGEKIYAGKQILIPTWHPAYPLHSGLKQPIKDIREALRLAKELAYERPKSEKTEV
jgi:uracil-DNA glycosylase family 4